LNIVIGKNGRFREADRMLVYFSADGNVYGIVFKRTW
jgi:hypothetical protein